MSLHDNRTHRRLVALVAAGALALALAACGDDSGDDEASDAEATTETSAAEVPEEEVQIGDAELSSAEDFTILLATLMAADLVDTLADDGPFTAFLPVEDAFQAALTDLGVTPEEFAADPGVLYAETDLLRNVLTYHVVEGEITPEELLEMDGEELVTVNGGTVTVSVNGDEVMINDATVIASGIDPSSISDVLAEGYTGQIYALDKVLIP